jgi:flagellar L-ring protein precursor FlgH
LLGALSTFAFSASAKKDNPKSPENLRAAYLARLQQKSVSVTDEHTLGSLWSPESPLGDFSVDYKARHLNDTITIQVAVQTSAAQSGTSDSERTFSTTSAITGVMGRSPASTNPLMASNTTFSTALTGSVIAVLQNGNLVVEAERKIFMNNQHEDIIVRGMIRPGDIGPGNTVSSTALSNLEIEMKGKGIISDGVRPLNPITRAVLWLLNF